MTRTIAPAHLLTPEFLESLSDRERLVLPYAWDLWLRPDQRIPRGRWRSYGFVAGRGFGKSLAIAVDINRRVQAGEVRNIGLMAPTEDRVRDVCILWLCATSPPWFKAIPYQDGVRWPNGARAYGFTPERPERPRGSNFHVSWLTELVDWQANGRELAYYMITTATRPPGPGQYYWDTTSRGKNSLILKELALHKEDPLMYRMVRGTMLDNPVLSRDYLRDQFRRYVPGTRLFREEVMGEIFAESTGALWQQEWIDAHRVFDRPAKLELEIVALDPANTATQYSDEYGIVHMGRDAQQHVYALEDHTGKYSPEQWGDLVVDICVRGAAGVVVETNNVGDNPAYVIRSRAALRGLQTRTLPRDNKPFPLRTPGVIYIREIHSRKSKMQRAAGAASETEAGYVHVVGTLADLEIQLTTYEGSGPSPGRYDAFVSAVNELRGLVRDKRNPRAAVAGAKSAQDVLRDELRAMHHAARVGL